jgi:hypothetical protein
MPCTEWLPRDVCCHFGSHRWAAIVERRDRVSDSCGLASLRLCVFMASGFERRDAEARGHREDLARTRG